MRGSRDLQKTGYPGDRPLNAFGEPLLRVWGKGEGRVRERDNDVRFTFLHERIP